MKIEFEEMLKMVLRLVIIHTKDGDLEYQTGIFDLMLSKSKNVMIPDRIWKC